MGNKAYEEWIKIFDTNIAESYKSERSELQKVAMLITGLQTEIKNVKEILELEFSNLQQRLKDKDILEEKVVFSDHLYSDLLKGPAQLQTESKITNSTNNMPLDNDGFSPDIFKNNSLKDIHSNSTIVDLSISDDSINDNIQESPTLTSKRKKTIKKFKKNEPEVIRKNIFKRTEKENSPIIDCTPEIQSKKKSSKTKNPKTEFCLSKKKKDSTITQLFSNMSTSNSSCNNTQSEEVDTTDNDKTFKDWIQGEDTTEMGITKLLSFINKDNTPCASADNDQNQDDDMDSLQEIDEFSKALFFDNSPPSEGSSPKKKLKVDPLIEPVVRGKARKLLKGFSCAECRNFYGNENLSPEKLQKLLDACSKHRYKYQPPDDTFPGIWDMTIPDENAKK